jgi:hypothetical protein
MNATATGATGSFLKVLPRPRLRVEQSTEFFVSMAARSHLSGAALFLCVRGAGAAVLTNDNRPAIRAVLWEGVPILSDPDAKSSPAGKVAGGSGKASSGKAGRSRRSSLGDIGGALSDAYKDTLKEQIPPDILALLGKLD